MRTIIVLRCLGVLLLVAAGLKAYGMAVEPVSAAGWFSSWFQFGLIEIEVLLGLWLIVASHPRMGWLTAFGLFTVFAIVSLYQAFMRQASCGCFGSVRVHPWGTFAFDASVLAALIISGPPRHASDDTPDVQKVLQQIALGAWGVLSVLAALATVGTIVFGSPAGALAALRGQEMVVHREPTYTNSVNDD